MGHSRSLGPIETNTPCGEEETTVMEEWTIAAGLSTKLARAAGIEEGPGFFAPLVAAGRRSGMLSPALILGSFTPRSAVTQALKTIMLHSTGGEEK